MADDDQFWPADWLGIQPTEAWQPAAAAAQQPASDTPMGLSQAGIDYIKGKEAWRPHAYYDGSQYSIGWGSKANNRNEVIDQDEGEQRLRAETQPLSDWLNKNVGPLTQGQHDALVSFGYNTGQGNLAKLKDDINAGDWQQITERMKSFNKAPSFPEAQRPGIERALLARRTEEGQMALGGQGPAIGGPAMAMAGAQPQGAPQAAAGAPAAPGRTAMRLGGPPVATATDDGSDLGSNLQQKPSLMSVLSAPGMQAGLLAAASSLLQGGWGGTGSAFGRALGAAGEAAGSSQAYQTAQEQEKQKMAQAKAISDAHNETQLEVAKIHAQSLKDVAQQRAINRNDPEWVKIHTTLLNDPKLITMDPTERYAMTMKQADEIYLHMKGTTGGAGAAGLTGPRGATAVNPAAGVSGVTGPGEPRKKVPEMSWDDLIKRPEWNQKEFDTNSAYRQKLTDRGFGEQVRAMERERGIKSEFLPYDPHGPLGKLLDLLRPKGGFFPDFPGGGSP